MSSGKLDNSLLHELDVKVIDDAIDDGATSGFKSNTKSIAAAELAPRTFPVIVRATSANWTPPDGVVLDTELGRFFTARVTASQLKRLEGDPDVERVSASREVEADEITAALASVRGNVAHIPPMSERGDSALVGVIDSGFDVLHECFLDGSGKSRILGLWDQRDPTGPPPPGFTFGTYHNSRKISGYIQLRAVPVALGRDPIGHGTHVASIAAGRAVGRVAKGVAPDAKLVFVISDIKQLAGRPKSMGYSKSHIDALAFLDGIADAENKPIAVNVSQGQNAGAHDGTSSLESAFDWFATAKPGRVLVKSAGNERGKNGHTHVVVPPGASRSIEWQSLSTPRPNDHFEFWTKRQPDLEFTLRDPKGQLKLVVNPGNQSAAGVLAAGQSVRMSFEQFHPDNGHSQLLISVKSTSGRIPVGRWKLKVVNRSDAQECVVDGWVERQKRRPVRFSTFAADDRTLSIPGTAKNVTTVSAVDQGRTIAGFSSRGGTWDNRERPDLCAPGTAIWAARSGSTAGAAIKSGTSMAAPYVTGAAALALSRRFKQGKPMLTGNQIRGMLANSAMPISISWSADSGYGLLDVGALLELV